MIVMSLFDGMSGAQQALERLAIRPTKYYSSEIDKYTIKVTQKNYPNTIQLGCVKIVRQMVECGLIPHVDLLVAGSPCQGFSFAGKQLAFDDPRSILFFEFVAILQALKKLNPKLKFMLENVSMKKEYLDVISMFLGVQPVKINSALVSAQNRVRYYWANWKIVQPQDRGIYLRDIIESGEVDHNKSRCVASSIGRTTEREYFRKNQGQMVADYFEPHVLSEAAMKRLERKKYSAPQIMPEKTGTLNTKNNSGQLSFDSGTTLVPLTEGEMNYMNREVKGGRTHWDFKHHSDTANDKSVALVANLHKGVPYNVLIDRTLSVRQYPRGRNSGFDKEMDKSPTLTANRQEQNLTVSTDKVRYRKLTPLECERLQTVADNYTGGGVVSDTQRYKMLGNGWTIEVIVHIFLCMLVSNDG